jgi:ribose transport system substrate-binding protein
MNDSTAESVVSAASRADREKDVVTVSQGAGTRLIRSEIRRLNACIVAATVFQPEEYGKQLIELAQKILEGEQVPPAVYIEHLLVDATNINDFYPKN